MLGGFVDSLYTSNTMPMAVVVIAMILGLLECFLGYRILKIQVAVMGFLVGVALGMDIMGALVGILWLSILVGVLLGLLLGFISFKIYKLGVFFTVAFFGFSIAFLFTHSALIALIIGIVLGILGVFLTKHIIILITAFGGASILANGVGNLIYGSSDAAPFWLTALIVVVVGVIGAVVQFTTTRGMKD